MIDIPSKHQDKYGWIARQFDQIPGVEIVKIDAGLTSLHIIASNRSTGHNRKMYRFQLKEKVMMNLKACDINFYDYDIMDLEDPQAIVNIGVFKAHKFFSENYTPPPGIGRAN